MEYNFRNEMEYLGIWCKLKQAYNNPELDKEELESINKRVAERLNVLHMSLKGGNVNGRKDCNSNKGNKKLNKG